jgi:tRNA nucleotidyltransferase (CCA-adding enzyme)
MKIYLVGGAVRDKLLGLPVKERDWVVVGATPQEMLKKGFKKVGRDFPVFLHPKTHEEYALARTERKTGKGYTNFVCHTDPSVTLEEDLKRRDLTVNALAEDSTGKIIDPYGGQKDLKNRILRHVSPAFAEDPVRILRVARFAARFGNFKIHPSTNKLMQRMLENGEVDALVPERVWQELERALTEKYPEKFFLALKNCQVLPHLFPEIASHFAAAKKGLKNAAKLDKNSQIRFAAMMFDLDKEEIVNICKRFRISNIYKELALLVFKLKNEVTNLSKNIDGIVTLLEHCDAYRKPERLKNAFLACQANNEKFPQIFAKIWGIYEKTKNVRLSPKTIAMEDKNKLKGMLHDKRVNRCQTP